MNILSIEAAFSPPTVALSLGQSVHELPCDDPRAQAEQVLGLIKQLLQEHSLKLGELDGIAVGRGPGSFTGLRVAAAVTQGLAYSADLPVANVSSLAAVAHGVFHHNPNDFVESKRPLLVCLDARKEQVYCALYKADELGRPQKVSEEAVLDPADVVAQFGDLDLNGAGNGFAEYPVLEQLGVASLAAVNPSATAVAIRAASGDVDFAAPFFALPEYVRNNVTHGS